VNGAMKFISLGKEINKRETSFVCFGASKSCYDFVPNIGSGEVIKSNNMGSSILLYLV